MYREMYAELSGIIMKCTGEDDPALADGGEHADMASSIAFRLAKKMKKSPAAIASELSNTIRGLELADITVTVSGPYVNFTFGENYVNESLKAAVTPGYGNLDKKENKVVLEHTSANPNGPLHVGHIRNTVIGDTLSRAFRKAGYQLEVQYYLNDMGRQIAIVAWGLDNLGMTIKEGEKSDHFIARVYIEANRRLADNPSIKEEIDRRMQLVENGNEAMILLFRNAVSTCIDGIKDTLALMNAYHDKFVWESEFIRNGDVNRLYERIEALPQCNIDETLYLDLSGFGIEKEYVLRRSDGTSVYSTRDLAYHIRKGREFDEVIDVLGADHKLIGTQLRTTLELLREMPPEIVHFEFVSLPEGSMSTRAGKFVSADELVREVVSKALTEVEKRRPDLNIEELEKIAQSIAIAAIRYDILKVSAEKSTVFDWKEALNFERQSGPYICYAHARACSILDKAGDFKFVYGAESESEIALAKLIAKFPYMIEKIVNERRPYLLAAYARDLADQFNTFYHNEPVLKSEGETRNRRLTLVEATRNTLKEAIETLGIDAIRSM